MSLTMFSDAIKHSTKIQLEAVFDSATVKVYWHEYHSYALNVEVSVIHKGKKLAYGQTFPCDLARDGNFYDEVLREGFARRVTHAISGKLMEEALNG